ncbi:MAG: COX15/CtaA family protein [Candidatus Omnitrophica bacterium]|nr:COX15/CtaA family protein [Candidatus Omnitrophota bacterium]MDE2009725.1 COX15/CtaA family protein [Candidatus Omnitrophota bacterium]MDE2213878.1 COX15/CtaA family protein [Candidatus Omnitrophota bacterium]MDE2231863.1 COX15/CtaA family protein [Candidatus Omnitrophota bacterium]
MQTETFALRRFSKFLCLLTLGLIFLGALVKSTDSGLSVPDWPTTYGKFIYAYPLNKMYGGIKFEQTHRLLASLVGMLTLLLTIWLLRVRDMPLWVRRWGIFAFVAVVLQGVLGGLGVIYFLPVWLTSLHGVLAQTFLLILIFIAYALSAERHQRGKTQEEGHDGTFLKPALFLMAMIYIQLIIGNVVRHSGSGLAVPDFPTMGWKLIPTFDAAWLHRINAWRFEHNMDPVTMAQVCIHLLHRFWAFLIVISLLWTNKIAYDRCLKNAVIMKTLYWLNIAIILQVVLGASTVLSHEEVYTTTLHVTTGAIVLTLSFIMVLRSAPIKWKQFKSLVFAK